jgi:hypothetical protein
MLLQYDVYVELVGTVAAACVFQVELLQWHAAERKFRNLLVCIYMHTLRITLSVYALDRTLFFWVITQLILSSVRTKLQYWSG